MTGVPGHPSRQVMVSLQLPEFVEHHRTSCRPPFGVLGLTATAVAAAGGHRLLHEICWDSGGFLWHTAGSLFALLHAPACLPTFNLPVCMPYTSLTMHTHSQITTLLPAPAGPAEPHLCGQPGAAHHPDRHQAAPLVPQEPAHRTGGRLPAVAQQAGCGASLDSHSVRVALASTCRLCNYGTELAGSQAELSDLIVSCMRFTGIAALWILCIVATCRQSTCIPVGLRCNPRTRP